MTRAEYNAAYWKANKSALLAKQRKKYQEDEEFREMKIAASKKWNDEHLEQRKKNNAEYYEGKK